MEFWNIPIEVCTPSNDAVLRAQGVPGLSSAEGKIIKLADEAVSIFSNLAKPVGVLSRISREDFKPVFYGEGNNQDEAPLENIYSQSLEMALFAVTMGQPVCEKITALFEDNDYAEGSMLDSAASEGADMAAQAIEHYFRDKILNSGDKEKSQGTMRFSPGYCGWHVSAQKQLFKLLTPEKIGITLNDSCLMSPLKSVSGVIIFGQKEIFQFDDSFEFCAECTDHSCQDRIMELMKTE
jgi:hypothetical protein